MRILIATLHEGLVGGVETYLAALLPKLRERGHQTGLVWEFDAAPGEPTVQGRARDAECWSLKRLGEAQTSASIVAWKPDVVFVHGLEHHAFETWLAERYPAAYFAHAYYGTCISGAKRHAFPSIRMCERRFGPACLVHYFPRRCGGLDPFTMVKLYRQQAGALGQMRQYGAILVASNHMREEYLRHGFPPERVHCVPLFPTAHVAPEEPPPTRSRSGRVLMASRLTRIKGSRIALSALREASEMLDRPLKLIVAGEGPDRQNMERQAGRLGVPTEFHGWVGKERMSELMREAEVLLVPSLWPEPFGLVGIEAGSAGLPAVAFGAGGIQDWLEPGFSGEAASCDPPTASGLADALVRALQDDEHFRTLQIGAWKKSSGFGVDVHLTRLEEILGSVGKPDWRSLRRFPQRHEPDAKRREARVLLVSFIPQSRTSGMGRWSHEVAADLCTLGNTVTLWHREDFPKTAALGRAGVLIFPLVLAWTLVLRRRSFDAVIFHEPIGFWYALLRRFWRSLPAAIAMSHGVESHVFEVQCKAAARGLHERLGFASFRNRLLRRWQSDGALRLADRVLCLSSQDRRYLHEGLGIPEERITTLVNGVREAWLVPATFRPASLRVLFVGTWIDRKGRRLIPEIWRRVCERFPGAELSIIGSNLANEIVQADFPQPLCGSVRVRPLVEDEADLRREYAGHDVLLLPSLFEGCPLVLLEAMAIGLPAVASRVCGMADLIAHERDGLLFESMNAQEAAEAVCRLLADPDLRERLARSAQQKARDCTWRRTAEAVLAAINGVDSTARLRTQP